MTATARLNNFKFKLIHLIVLFGLLQLLISFLTDGFGFSFDEAMWAYIGRNWFRHGLTPYSGGVDNKSPLIFAIFGLSDKLFGVNYWFPRVMGTICQSVGIFFIYKSAKHIAGAQAGIIAITLYGLSLLWHCSGAKYVSYTETYAVTCIIIAFYKWLVAQKRNDFFISGLIAALGAAFRISACFGIAAIFIASFRHSRRAVVFFLFGVLSGLVLFMLMMYLAGINLHDFIFYSFADNFGSGSPTDHSFLWRAENFLRGFFYSELILFYPLVIGYLLIKKRFDFLSIWAIAEFIGINAIGFYSYQHFKNILPALSLMSAISIAYLIETYKVPAKQLMIIIWISFFPKTIEPFVSVKKIFVSPPDKSETYCHEPYQEPDEDSKRKLGLWIKSNTTADERVLIAGYGAAVQVYTERLSPSIYFNVTQTQRAKQIFMKEVYSNKPDMIAVPMFASYTQNVGSDLRLFINDMLEKNYDLKTCMYGYSIYRIKKTIQ